ncbi:MAG: redoxin domain-containing protein [Candidatus Marinimicrobia bacterium]|nr:redoxin domain-containing protein [Candidatus Neomarinimicrobiota bacterium]
MIRYTLKYITTLILILSIGFSAENSIKVGDQAPPISLFKLESNKYFRSKELLGEKILVVSFFATWCVPCAKEILELKYYINTEERSKRINEKHPFFIYATGNLSIIRIENNEEIYYISLPESKGADFNQKTIAGKRAIKKLLKEIDDKDLLGLN